MRRALPLFALALAHTPMAIAETRQLDAHEHGTGELNISVEGDKVALDLEAPGFDIVGFEYEATTDEDKAKMDAAMKTLSTPDAVFVLPAAAGCDVTKAKAHLAGDGSHNHEKKDDHDHDHDAHDKDEDHDHAHKEDKHDEDHAHKDHGHDDKDDDHAHDDHDHEESHSAFHAHFRLTCSDPSKLTRIELPYFQTFANAEKLEVQIVTDAGAKAVEATREAPALDL